jgi:hypothetical protein
MPDTINDTAAEQNDIARARAIGHRAGHIFGSAINTGAPNKYPPKVMEAVRTLLRSHKRALAAVTPALTDREIDVKAASATSMETLSAEQSAFVNADDMRITAFGVGLLAGVQEAIGKP